MAVQLVKAGSASASATAMSSVAAAPLYHQIFVKLRDRIYLGEFPDGSFLPSEQELSKMFGVSRITAKRALDEIAATGLAVREQGRGTRVCIATRSTSIRGNIEGLIHSLHAKGYSSVRLLEFEYVPAPAELAEKLKVDPGSEVQRAVRVWYGDGGPFSHLTTYVPGSLARGWRQKDLENKTMIALLEERGVRVGRAEDHVTAASATMDIAARLDVTVGAALLQVTRTVFDQQGQPVELLIGLYPPDRYQYSVTLGR